MISAQRLLINSRWTVYLSMKGKNVKVLESKVRRLGLPGYLVTFFIRQNENWFQILKFS